jgi:hypothetical protein
MGGLGLTRNVAHLAIGGVIADVGGFAAGIEAEEEAGPAMEVHRLRGARWGKRDLEDADEAVFEDDVMACRGGLDRIEASGEAVDGLCGRVMVEGDEQQRTEGNREEAVFSQTHGDSP